MRRGDCVGLRVEFADGGAERLDELVEGGAPEAVLELLLAAQLAVQQDRLLQFALELVAHCENAREQLLVKSETLR